MKSHKTSSFEITKAHVFTTCVYYDWNNFEYNVLEKRKKSFIPNYFLLIQVIELLVYFKMKSIKIDKFPRITIIMTQKKIQGEPESLSPFAITVTIVALKL